MLTVLIDQLRDLAANHELIWLKFGAKTNIEAIGRAINATIRNDFAAESGILSTVVVGFHFIVSSRYFIFGYPDFRIWGTRKWNIENVQLWIQRESNKNAFIKYSWYYASSHVK